MQDISKYTKNAQKYIKYDWAACEAGCKGNDEELERILDEREKFCDENFTLDDYDSMIDILKKNYRYPPMTNAWIQGREIYITEHQQMNIKDLIKRSGKVSNK